MFLLRSFPLEKENVAYLQFNPSESTKRNVSTYIQTFINMTPRLRHYNLSWPILRNGNYHLILYLDTSRTFLSRTTL